LVVGLSAHGHRSVRGIGGAAELTTAVHEMAQPGDMVVCLGAGSITNWANALPAELAQLDGKSRGA